MSVRRRSVLALLSAAALCGAAATAPARNLSVSTRPFRVVWTPLTAGLRANESEAEVLISCNVTMEGSLHSSTIAKVAGSLIGYISGATIDARSCRESLGLGGSFSLLAGTLPWHVRYTSFEGTLPLVTGVRVSFAGMGLGISAFGINCLARSSTERPARWILGLESGGVSTGLSAEAGGTLPPPTGLGCERWHAVYSGIGRVTRPEGTGTVRVVLI